MAHHPDHDQKNLVIRMNKIEGQVKGVKKMIEADEPFETIIIQLNAIKSATQKVSQILLEAQLDHTFMDATEMSYLESEMFKKLKKAINQYSKIL